MRLYAPAILLFVLAAWLAAFGDGLLFGVVALGALGVTVVIQIREQRRQFALRKKRSRR